MNTLLLDQASWDLVLDISGNIALATEPYAIAQDVASAIRTFTGDLWYDQTRGIPYFDRVLGHAPSMQYLRSQIESAALSVPGVVKAQCLFARVENRLLRGQCKIIDTTGAAHNVSF